MKCTGSCSLVHLHTSRYSVIIPLHNPLTNVAILKLGLKMLVTLDCYCLPTNQIDLFNQSSEDLQFSPRTHNGRLSLIDSIWCIRNQSNTSPIFNSFFCQEIEVGYHNAMTCEDVKNPVRPWPLTMWAENQQGYPLYQNSSGSKVI